MKKILLIILTISFCGLTACKTVDIYRGQAYDKIR